MARGCNANVRTLYAFDKERKSWQNRSQYGLSFDQHCAKPWDDDQWTELSVGHKSMLA